MSLAENRDGGSDTLDATTARVSAAGEDDSGNTGTTDSTTVDSTTVDSGTSDSTTTDSHAANSDTADTQTDQSDTTGTPVCQSDTANNDTAQSDSADSGDSHTQTAHSDVSSGHAPNGDATDTGTTPSGDATDTGTTPSGDTASGDATHTHTAHSDAPSSDATHTHTAHSDANDTGTTTVEAADSKAANRAATSQKAANSDGTCYGTADGDIADSAIPSGLDAGEDQPADDEGAPRDINPSEQDSPDGGTADSYPVTGQVAVDAKHTGQQVTAKAIAADQQEIAVPDRSDQQGAANADPANQQHTANADPGDDQNSSDGGDPDGRDTTDSESTDPQHAANTDDANGLVPRDGDLAGDGDDDADPNGDTATAGVGPATSRTDQYRPQIRTGVQRVDLVSVRSIPYAMFRSPDHPRHARYLRLTREEADLAELMDGTRTVAGLIAEFARISGYVSPDQVNRVIAELAGNGMLREATADEAEPDSAPSPVGPPPGRRERRSVLGYPVRLARALLDVVRGRRLVLANPDFLLSILYRAGGRWLFTPFAVALATLLIGAGLALFGWSWWHGGDQLFLTNGSYRTGAAVLLGLHLVAQTCHQLGHALATKHAGRRVPTGGLLLQYGLPSVFLDTTEIWLAGRRARLRTTVSGPVAGLALAGAAQVTGVLVPAASDWGFKLAFLCYLQTLISLSPLLPLDGHYLLVDWFEMPDLRVRARAWLRPRLRRGGRRSGNRLDALPDNGATDHVTIDWERRIIARYGLLTALWLVITALAGWRIWADRLAGVATALWPAQWSGTWSADLPDRVLLVLIGAALTAPALYGVAGWVGRRARRLRHWLCLGRGRRRARRLAVLESSPLGELPLAVLNDLARRARWLRPYPGRPIPQAAAGQPNVLFVVDGVVVGRRPDDPAGTVRRRIGPGGTIGLASALTGTLPTLTWYASGEAPANAATGGQAAGGEPTTVLLTVPAALVTAAVGRLPAGASDQRAQAEQLIADTPALEALTDEDRAVLAGLATPHELAACEPIFLRERNSAVIVDSGVILLSEGTALRRGTMIGPVDADLADPVAFCRSDVRLWSLPPLDQLPPLFGTAADAGSRTLVGAGPPTHGAHPTRHYPPMQWPAGPPPAAAGDDADAVDAADRRLTHGPSWLASLLAIIALLLAGAVLRPGPAWAEMPTRQALLTVDRGRVTVTIHGGTVHTSGSPDTVRLSPGDRLYVGIGDRIDVTARAKARLSFHGGGVTVLCPLSQVGVDELSGTSGVRVRQSRGRLTLDRGRLLADTGTPSRAFTPLALTVHSQGSTIVNEGSAWYAVDAGNTVVSTGRVRRDGSPQPSAPGALSCGDGVPVERPAGISAEPTSPSPTPTPSSTGSPSPTPTSRPSTEPVRRRTPSPKESSTNGRPTPTRTTPDEGGETPPEEPEPPVVTNQPPVVSLSASASIIARILDNGSACGAGSTSATVSVSVSDDGGADNVTVTLYWEGFDNGQATLGGGASRGRAFGPYSASAGDPGGALIVWAQASDGENDVTSATTAIAVTPCTAPLDGQ